MGILSIRKLADKSTGSRVPKFDPNTGERKLINPDTPGNEHEPWPLKGIAIEGDLPEHTAVGVAWVNKGIAEGWLRRDGEETVHHRPGGPADNPWTITHSFVHMDKLILDTVDGPVTYKVVWQPDKYVMEVGDDSAEDWQTSPVTAEDYADGNTTVEWSYGLELLEDGRNGSGK